MSILNLTKNKKGGRKVKKLNKDLNRELYKSFAEKHPNLPLILAIFALISAFLAPLIRGG